MKDFEQKVKTYLEERKWNKLRPSDLAKSIMIEGAELLEIFQWDNLSYEEIKADPVKMEKIRKELADVMVYCFDMSVILGIDTEDMLTAKLKKNAEKYPPHLFTKELENPGTEDIYWEIKEKQRKEGEK